MVDVQSAATRKNYKDYVLLMKDMIEVLQIYVEIAIFDHGSDDAIRKCITELNQIHRQLTAIQPGIKSLIATDNMLFCVENMLAKMIHGVPDDNPKQMKLQPFFILIVEHLLNANPTQALKHIQTFNEHGVIPFVNAVNECPKRLCPAIKSQA